MRATIDWYRDNRDWWEPIKRSGEFREYYDQQYAARLELAASSRQRLAPAQRDRSASRLPWIDSERSSRSRTPVAAAELEARERKVVVGVRLVESSRVPWSFCTARSSSGSAPA